MSLAVIQSRASYGINAPLVTVEVHLSNGLPSMSVVGLASAEVKESKERVRSALLNSGFDFPARRIIINLGPADLPKSGGRFDLSIALGILIASEQLEEKYLENFEVLGELALNGELRSVSGVLNATIAAVSKQKNILLPRANASEALLTEAKTIFAASTLKEVCIGLENKQSLLVNKPKQLTITTAQHRHDIGEIKGNQHAKRALLVAAAADHNILFAGSPGTGKTMLARTLPSLLADMSLKETMEIVAIESISKDDFTTSHCRRRRFRAPHHNCTVSSITGGGRIPVPGEISLAHRGVLFFDELPEFSRSVLESLRQPLEDGHLTVSRAQWKVNFPAKFQFVAAMNPCPCGYFASDDKECHCSKAKILQYLGRLSGPLLDRIDIQVMVNNPRISLLDLSTNNQEKSQEFRDKIEVCRELQIKRQGMLNNDLAANIILELSHLDKTSRQVFNQAIKHHQLSIRAQQKVLRVARTIADLEGLKDIKAAAIIEALSYRLFDQLLKKARKLI